MRTKMLQRRLEKLEALQKDDAPALVTYRWVSPDENNGAEAGAAEPHKQTADRRTRGGTVENFGADPAQPRAGAGIALVPKKNRTGKDS
jgi:hypothetical protein